MTDPSDAPRKPPRLRPGDTVGVVAPASSLGEPQRAPARRRRARGLGPHGPARRPRQRPPRLHGRPRRGPRRGPPRDARRPGDPGDRLPPGRLRHAAPHPAPRRGAVRREPEGDLRLQRPHDAPPRRGSAGATSSRFYSNGASGVGSPEVTDFSKESLHRALFSDEPYGPIGPNPDDPYVRTIVGGRATGRLAGGCAGLLSSAIGTRLQPDFRGRIVCPRGDRDGGLRPRRDPDPAPERGAVRRRRRDRRRRHQDEVVRRDRRALGRGHRRGGPRRRSACRSIFGLPIGHGKHHATVPLGAMATLDADAGTLVVEEVVTAD